MIKFPSTHTFQVLLLFKIFDIIYINSMYKIIDKLTRFTFKNFKTIFFDIKRISFIAIISGDISTNSNSWLRWHTSWNVLDSQSSNLDSCVMILLHKVVSRMVLWPTLIWVFGHVYKCSKFITILFNIMVMTFTISVLEVNN